MKVLVTGGAGFIGSHVVDAFVSAGHDVVIVDNMSSGRERNLNPKAKLYKLDIRDAALDDVFAAEKPDIVDHHAAQIDVRRSVADPLFDADVNVKGSLNLLEMARKHDVKKVVYASTGGAVYGEPDYLPCDEKHPINPICHYGASKYVVEKYLFMYKHLYGMNYTVLRYSNVYGPRQDPHGEAGVVAIFSGRMLRGESVTIFGDGTQQRDFVYVKDVARANLLAAQSDVAGVFNIGVNRGTSVNELFDVLKDVTAYSPDANYGPARAGETYRIWLSHDKITATLDWSPLTGLEAGLSETVDFFRQQEPA